MSRMIYCLTLIIFTLPGMATGTAAPTLPQCPSVTVEGTDELVCPSEEVTLTATVTGGDANIQKSFHWTVSAGEITGGQGTPTVTVKTATPGESIIATVKVGGLTALTANCSQMASHTIQVGSCCAFASKFDGFGDIDFNDEKARLDNFAIQLLAEPGVLGYILVYAGKRAHVNEAKTRLERAKDYLVNKRAIQAERIVTIDGGYREELTSEIWILPPSVPPPTPDTATTIDPAQVEIIPDPPQPTGRRGHNH